MTTSQETIPASNSTGTLREAPDVAAETVPSDGDNNLDRRSASGFEVFGQSLAATGPSIAIAGTVAIVFLSAGKGNDLLVLSGHLRGDPGRLQHRGVRPAHGSGGIALHLHGIGSGPRGCIRRWLGHHLRLPGHRRGVPGRRGSLFRGVCDQVGGERREQGLADASHRGVLRSRAFDHRAFAPTSVAVILEIVSLVAIGVLIVALFVHYGPHVDTSQFKAHGSNATGIALGTVLAVGAFVGFESSASLGIEAKNPHRAIPRAILFTALGAGVLYIVSAYAQVLGFPSPTVLAAESAPLNGLASTAGVGWLAYYLDLAVAISAFGVVAASLNAAARGVYSLGREEILPKDFGGRIRSTRPHTSPCCCSVQ